MPTYPPFVRRQRRAARVALYSAVALSIGVVLALVAYLRVPLGPLDDAGRTVEEWEAVRAVALLQAYVRIDTREREIEGARFLARELESIGLEPVIEPLGDGHANVWAILEGRQPDAVVLHHHIDVYPTPLADEWEHPPFAGTIDPPFLYGRGVYDMKSLAIAQLEALRRVAELGRPERTVIFLATAGEESGSHLGTRWVLRHHPELVERFATVLTEGGVVEPTSVSEIKYWGIETAQRRYAEGIACAARREPLETLQETLWTWQRGLSPPTVIPEARRFAEVYAPTREDDVQRERLTAVLDGSILPIEFRGMKPYLKSLFLDEIVPFPVVEQPDGSFSMRLVANLLPGSDLAATLGEKLPGWLTHGLDVQFGPVLGASAGSPVDHPSYAVLEAAIRRHHPDVVVGPFFLAWSATDARFFRQLGVPSYGFSPFVVFNTESFRADDINERINLPGYVRGVELYGEAVEALVSGDPATTARS